MSKSKRKRKSGVRGTRIRDIASISRNLHAYLGGSEISDRFYDEWTRSAVESWINAINDHDSREVMAQYSRQIRKSPRKAIPNLVGTYQDLLMMSAFGWGLGDAKNYAQLDVYASVAKLMNPKPGNLVLDLGCGAGDLGQAILKNFPEVRILGIDKNPYSLEIAARTFNNQGVSVGKFTDSHIILDPRKRIGSNAIINIRRNNFRFLSNNFCS